MSTDKVSPSHRSGILRSTAIMTAGTLLSRVLGFGRDIIFALFFGTASTADAFVVAFRLPNLFRDLLGEGAANSSFIPVLTEYRKNKPEELADFINVILCWAFIILCGITLLGVIFAPTVVSLVAPGFTADPQKVTTAVTLTRIMFPYLIFIGVTAFLSAIQFTCGAYMIPALGPCLLNIALIASTFLSVWFLKEPVYGLAFGVIAGGALQLYFQWQALRSHGVRLSWPSMLKHPGALQVGRLVLPRVLGSAVYQINVFIDTICASLSTIVGPGGISAVYYANRLVLLPVGLFAVSLVSACLPVFSSCAVAGDKEGFRRAVRDALGNIVFLMVPSAVVLVLFAGPVVRVMFQRGVFDAYSTAQTSVVLLFFAMGLVFFGMTKVMASAFHALQDTRTPVKIALVSLGVNALLNAVLMFPLKLGGIALASSLASVVGAFLLFQALRRRIGGFEDGLLAVFRKVALAAVLQGVVAWGFWLVLPLKEIWKLVAVLPVSAVVYLGAGFFLGLDQVQRVVRRLDRRIG